MESANPVKNCTKRCTVIHYILTENEQEKILTRTIIKSILTSNYISPFILTENEQEKILTHTIIKSILTSNYISPSIWAHTYNHWINVNIQLHQSIHLTQLQAISSTVKSHNHKTLKKKNLKLKQLKKKKKAQAAVV